MAQSNGDFLRIVDYKTGSKKFDYTDLYGGAGMQMLLYLFALEQSGLPGISDRPKPAGVLYFPARRSFASADGPEDGESAHAPVQRSGIILSEDGVPEAMEHGDSYQYIPVKKTKSGMGDYVVSSQQLRLLQGLCGGSHDSGDRQNPRRRIPRKALLSGAVP